MGSAYKPTPPAMGCCLVGLLMSRLGGQLSFQPYKVVSAVRFSPAAARPEAGEGEKAC